MRSKLSGKLLAFLVVLVLAGIILFSGFYRVGQGEEALVITFGRVTATHGPGLYFRIPFVQSIISESVTAIHTMEYGFRTTSQGSGGRASQYRDDQEERVMLTNDNSIVEVDAIYQYTIRDVKQYHFDVDKPEDTLQYAFEAVMRRNIQSLPLDDALLKKEEIQNNVLPEFQRIVDSYEMGVKINSVRIQNIAVPSAVAASYEDVSNAKNETAKLTDEAIKYKNEVLPAARSKAYQLKKDAEAYKAETVAAAKAEVAVFELVYEKYKAAPEITKKRLLIETMEHILKNSGKIIVADNESNVLKVLDVNNGEVPTAAVSTGGQK